MNRLIIICGKTNFGKSTLKNALLQHGFESIVTYTTRSPRLGEVNGVDYHFVSEEEYSEINKSKEFCAYTEINGYKYATTLEELSESDIYVIDPAGAEYLKAYCGDRFKFVEIYFSSPFELAKSRYIKRDGDEESFYSRYNSEDKQFSEYEKKADYDHLFVNDMSFLKAANALYDLLKSEMEKEQLQ